MVVLAAIENSVSGLPMSSPGMRGGCLGMAWMLLITLLDVEEYDKWRFVEGEPTHSWVCLTVKKYKIFETLNEKKSNKFIKTSNKRVLW